MFEALKLLDATDIEWFDKFETTTPNIKSWQSYLCYVFHTNNQQPLGYACFQTIVDELHLLNFWVAPQFRDKKIATMALKSIQTKFKNSKYKSILLEVRESNKIAINLYKKRGFIVDGMRKDYYPTSKGKESSVLMSYRFNIETITKDCKEIKSD